MFIRPVGRALALALMSTAAIVSTEALAADLPSRRAPPVYVPPPAIPVFTWTGFYIGGQVGYEFGKSSNAVYDTSGVGYGGTRASPSGVIGGGHVGYNFSTQSLPGFGGALGTGGVFGIEGDVDGSNYRSTTALGGITDYAHRNIQGSVRGRLGIAVDRALFYATGGAAFGSLKNSYTNIYNGFGDFSNHTRVGYTVGGGIEYAVTNNVSLRAEYRYTDFGSYNDPLTNSFGGAVYVHHRDTDNRVQGGFSYRFDTTPIVPPVVARY